MPNKLAYIYACDVFIKICFRDGSKKKRKERKNLVIGPRCFFPGYGNPCRSQSPSTNTRRSDILLKKRHT